MIDNITWKKLVSAGEKIELDDNNIKWKWGDIGLQVKIAAKECNCDYKDSLREWIEAIGSTKNLRCVESYIRVSESFPPVTRVVGVSYFTYLDLYNCNDRFDIINNDNTIEQIKKLMAERNPARYNGNSVSRSYNKDAINNLKHANVELRRAIYNLRNHNISDIDSSLINEILVEFESNYSEIDKIINSDLHIIAA